MYLGIVSGNNSNNMLSVNLQYSSPSILQPSILRPLLIIRPLHLVSKGNILC